MSKTMNIERIDPPAAIPGGEIGIDLSGAGSLTAASARISIDESEAHIVAASNRRILALVPGIALGGTVNVSVHFDGDESASFSLQAGRKLADGLHPVANPAFDPGDGSLFVTRSG